MRSHTYTLIHCDWSAAPFSRWERLWGVLSLPWLLLKFAWTGKFTFLRLEKEVDNDIPS